MKKITALFLCFAMVLGMTACGGKTTQDDVSEDTSETETTTEEETYVYPESIDNFFTIKSLEGWIKLHGRQIFTEDGHLTCDWSLNGFTIRVNAKGGTFKVHYETSYNPFFVAHVDGEEVFRGECPSENTEFEFQVPAGEHTIDIYKETEVSTSIGNKVDLTGITFEGEILKREPDKDLLIEVIGDSISCGDGSLGVYTKGQKWSKEDHSATHSFTYYLQEKLDADVTLCGRGGIGLCKDAGGFTMDILYDGLCFYRDKTPFKPERIPDVIVLEMGANDGSSTCTEQEYSDKLENFIQHLRGLYGKDTAIVWVGKSVTHYESMRRIILNTGDSDKMLFAVQHDYGGAGSAALETQSAGHPDAKGQEGFADAIIKCLKQNNLVK